MQLSIFEIPENYETKEPIINNQNELIQKTQNNNETVEILNKFEFHSNVFTCKLQIGKINNKFDYTLNYHFKTGTFEGCGIPWNHVNDRHLFSTKENAFNHCRKYLLMRMSHIPERSDTSQVQKNEIPKIIDYINNLFL